MHFEVPYIFSSCPPTKWWAHDPHEPSDLNPDYKDIQLEGGWGWIIVLAASKMYYFRNSRYWGPWSCPTLVLLRLVFFFTSAFSCIIPISSLLLAFARICFCCLQTKDCEWDKCQQGNDTKGSARFFGVGPASADADCVMTQCSHNFLHLFILLWNLSSYSG